MGTLSWTVTQTATAVDLTALAGEDWALFADSGGGLTPNERKSGGGSLISASILSSGSAQFFSTDPRTVSWTDGTPTGSGSSTGGQYNEVTVGVGFTVSFPAGTGTRTARVYCGGYSANAIVRASLSDASASPLVDSTTLAGASGTAEDGELVITYSADSPGQTLSVSIEIGSIIGGYGNVTLSSAAVSSAGGGGSSLAFDEGVWQPLEQQTNPLTVSLW